MIGVAAAHAPEGPDPRYNLRPGEGIWNVAVDADVRDFALYRWGFLPSWARPGAHEAINARTETLASSAYFRGAWRARRSLIFVDGFYEWRKPDGRPFFVRAADGRPLALAGVYEPRPQGGMGCAIVTTTANALIAPFHPRMPAIVAEFAYDLWLGPDALPPESVSRLLAPADAGSLVAYPVGREVNDPRQEGRALMAKAPG